MTAMTSFRDLVTPLTRDEIAHARLRIADLVTSFPLTRSAGCRLKLECLQAHGSYKLRGATNALRSRQERGIAVTHVVSASAGNFGQAIAGAANACGLPVTIHVPTNAARIKVSRLKALGATVHEHSFDAWWQMMASGAGDDEFFHPVCDRDVIAGSATIGAEIAAELPEVSTVFIPIGGGGLCVGVAQALYMTRPDCRIVAVESEFATPLTAAMAAGAPITVRREPSFVDGMGSTGVLDAMWPLLRRSVHDVAVVSGGEIEDAIRRLLSEHHVMAEGAGAAAFAAASKADDPRSVAIISGGNIDLDTLRQLL